MVISVIWQGHGYNHTVTYHIESEKVLEGWYYTACMAYVDLKTKHMAV